MIPADLAARLRLLTEARFFADEPPLEPLQPTRAIPHDLPEFRPGDRFTAQIQQRLADGSFEALVDGRTIRLALPGEARPGQTLELVVARQTPRAVLAHAPPAAAAESGARAALSPTARLISFLLTGQPAPAPAPLAGGQPLAPAGPVSPTQLAAQLRQALGESGLFYEAQQARWLAGKVPTEALLRQPQGQQSAPPGAPPQPATPITTTSAATEAPPQQGAEAAARSPSVAAPRTEAVAERLLPVMHQQLDALATHHYAWQGQVWPGQPMELEIEDPLEEQGGETQEAAPWKTTLRLTLPRLGGVEARLELDARGVRIRLEADSEAAAFVLGGERTALADALEAAGVPLKDMQVGLQ